MSCLSEIHGIDLSCCNARFEQGASDCAFKRFKCLQLIDALASQDAADTIRQLALWFTYLGLITFVCHFLETGMFMWSGVRQSTVLVQLKFLISVSKSKPTSQCDSSIWYTDS
jgi:hypothetical protein